MTNQAALKDILDWILHIAAAVVIALLLVNFVGRFTVVKGSSMQPTLQDQNVLVIEKLTKTFRGIRRGDIVVLKIPEFLIQNAERNKVYVIKRVIALENQTVEIKNGKVFVDGKLLEEDYINGKTTLPANDNYTKMKVPPGCIYVMGDNRKPGMSRDSRVFGPVSLKKVSGRAVFRIFPFNEMGAIN